jgi:hypothetical protein
MRKAGLTGVLLGRVGDCGEDGILLGMGSDCEEDGVLLDGDVDREEDEVVAGLGRGGNSGIKTEYRELGAVHEIRERWMKRSGQF